MSLPYAEVIGDPIAQSKSPTIHKFWLKHLGIAADYRACHVRPDELEAYLHSRQRDPDWRGCNVTMPHKQAVIPFLDDMAENAARIGAVNTITNPHFRLTGDNTDGIGFMEAILPHLHGQTSRFAHVIGAGGAARAVVDALDQHGFTIISYSRNPAKTDRELGRYIGRKDLLLPIEMLAQPWDGHTLEADGDRIDLLVNTSPLGMKGQPALSVDMQPLSHHADTIVYDIVTDPVITPLLHDAQDLGLNTIDGLSMLIGQAAAAFEKFFGAPPPRDDGDAALRAILTA